MSSEVTTSTRARGIAKLLRPLSVSGILAVQDLARNMNDLVEVLQAPALNDASGRRMIANIEAVARVVVPAIMDMDGGEEGDDDLNRAEVIYVEHLRSFNNFLKDTKKEVEEQLGRSGTSKVVRRIDIQELLVERERR